MNGKKPDKPSFVVDALPLTGKGGISNYVRPLVAELARQSAQTRELQLLFRRFGRSPEIMLPEYEGASRTTRLPDRMLSVLWGMGIPYPYLNQRPGDVFLATTEMVPLCRTARTGWIVYDLTPVRIPRFFSADTRPFLQRMCRLAARTDFIIAISECTKRDVVDLLEYPAERVVVVYPGVPSIPSALPQPAPAQKRPYVVYIGALALNKNVDGLIRIFARCVREYGVNVDLVLCGRDFQPAGFWLKEAEKAGVAGRVRTTGWLSEEQRWALLRNASMLWQFSWYEGFGLPVLEAAAAGVPVICSNRGSLPEIMCNPEQEIDPDDETGAALKIAGMCMSGSVRVRLSEHGRRRADLFSWEKNVDGLLRFIEC